VLHPSAQIAIAVVIVIVIVIVIAIETTISAVTPVGVPLHRLL
jgi:hypothetical protein